jgi:spore coat polysaccharide biosynthesis protein SpsF
MRAFWRFRFTCSRSTGFCGAAAEAKPDVAVRITADCPLIDPEVVDLVVSELLTHKDEYDYASNVIRRTYPRGLDVEALLFDTLVHIERLAASDAAREHVTWFAYKERPDLFRALSVELSEEDHSELNWSVDTEEDLKNVREIFERLGLSDRSVSWRDILLETQPR